MPKSQPLNAADSLLLTSQVAEFRTKEEAEKAFMKMLKDVGITGECLWEDALRLIVSNPIYRALPSVVERREVFLKYIRQWRDKERQERLNRYLKRKEEFCAVLSNSKNVNAQTGWKAVEDIFGGHAAFKAFSDPKERLYVFDEYINELLKKEKEVYRSNRKPVMESLKTFMRELNFTAITRWKDAKVLLLENEKFEEKYAVVDMLDVMSVFGDLQKELQTETEEHYEKERRLLKRKERKAREKFKTLLVDLQRQGVISLRTKWKEIFPIIEYCLEYENLLGMYGSTPLELFRDVTCDLFDKIKGKGHETAVLGHLKDKSLSEGSSVVDLAKEIAAKINVELDVITAIIDRQQLIRIAEVRRKRKQEEMLFREEMIEFEKYLHGLDSALISELTYEQLLPSIQEAPEFKRLGSDALRRSCFQSVTAELSLSKSSEEEEGQIV